MDQPLVFLSAVLGLGILAQWIAWRLQIPSILVLLGVGFLVGFLCGDNPNVAGETITDEILTQRLLFPLVSLAVGVIMFEGGLTLRFHELADTGRIVFRLVAIGTLVTWALATWSAVQLIGMNGSVAALTGAVLVVTGPTVIAPLLRHVRPYRRIGSIVKWEGIVIDPIGAILAMLVFDALFAGDASQVGWLLASVIAIGFGLGLSAAAILVVLMKRYWIPDFLHNPVFLAMALAVYSASNLMVPEAGLLTVTVMGVALANQKRVAVRHVVEFKENLRVLLISCLFIVLAARIQVADIIELGWGGVAFVAVLIVVIRPLAVYIATIGSELSWQERSFLALLAPRGIVAAAVSTVFGLEVAELFHHADPGGMPAGYDKIASLTFLVIVSTVAIYGLMAAPLARRLGLAAANPQGLLIAGAAPWVRHLAKLIDDEGFRVLLVDTNYRNTAAASMEGVPSQCASIVSEYMEEVDLGGIGRLLAMTPNDDLNTLATAEYATVFGSANVFQLPYRERRAGRRNQSANHAPGRHLFAESATYSNLAFRVAAGDVFKKTRISETFSFEDFRDRYGDEALVLFLVTEAKTLEISTIDVPLTPRAGQTVIALVQNDTADET